MDEVIDNVEHKDNYQTKANYHYLHLMSIDKNEVEARKQWLQVTKEDVANLQLINPIIKKNSDNLFDSVLKILTKQEEFKSFFSEPNLFNEYKNLQREYFTSLTIQPFDQDYYEARLRLDSKRANMGLDVKWFLSAYNLYFRKIASYIIQEYATDIPKAHEILNSLTKLIFLDLGLAFDTYLYQRQVTIHKQQEAIRELSTPVLQLREEVLILPIIGAMDALRARQITEQLLYAIRDRRAKVVVVDITGVPTVDSRVANHLMQTVDAARLMGATIIVTGLSAEVAQTLVTIGVDLSKINTVGDLQGGIEEADKIVGYRVVKIKKEVTEKSPLEIEREHTLQE